MDEDSLTIRCLVGSRNSVKTFGLSLKRKNPERAPEAQPKTESKALRLEPVQKEILKMAFPKLGSYLNKETDKDVGCFEMGVDGFGDTLETKRPSVGVIEAIVALIANNTISPG